MSAYNKENSEGNYVGSISSGFEEPSVMLIDPNGPVSARAGSGGGTKTPSRDSALPPPPPPPRSPSSPAKGPYYAAPAGPPAPPMSHRYDEQPQTESMADSTDYSRPYGDLEASPMPMNEGELGGSGGMMHRGNYDDSVSFIHRRPLDESSAGQARMMRVFQAESVIREEMFKEFTFRPKIKPLPSSYGAMKNQDPDFHTRVTKWEKEKEMSRSQKLNAKSQSDVSQCTFKPKINRNSARAVKEIRGEASDLQGEMAGERLHSTHAQQNEERMRLIEEQRLKEELAEAEECTFAPQLVTKKELFSGVHARYELEPKPKTLSDPVANKDCTFTPKVNKIRPSMSSAKLYVSANVVDRLTRPIAVPHSADTSRDDMSLSKTFDNGDRQVMDVATFMSGGGGGGNNFATPGPAQHRAQGVDAGMSAEERRARAQNFDQFMYRQEMTLERRRQTREVLVTSMQPAFRPRINPSTITTTAEERTELAKQKKIEKEQQSAIKSEPFTFKPKINKRSEKIVARSTVEMSDYKAQQKLKKIDMEKQDAELTFKPKIFTEKTNKNAKSTLQISTTDTSDYINWLNEKKATKEAKALEEQRKREEEELEECTFAPQTRDCPAYVKRIASSLKVVKSAAKQNGGAAAAEASTRPEWK